MMNQFHNQLQITNQQAATREQASKQQPSNDNEIDNYSTLICNPQNITEEQRKPAKQDQKHLITDTKLNKMQAQDYQLLRGLKDKWR